jgi:glycosyltransferase involved in cell wall biosynthesis
MPTPGVSVILPTFNRLAYLREAIDSVLAQTYTDWELIIADDGSADETQTFLRSIRDGRVKILCLPHCGNPAAVRNSALVKARGMYLAFLDSDDLWAPRKLEIQLNLMQSRGDRRWSYTKDRPIDACGNPLPEAGIQPWLPYEGSIVEPLLSIDAIISTPTVVAERSLVNEVGGFDEEQRFGEDYDLWLRLAMRSEVSVSCEPLVCTRAHLDNYSQDRVAAYRGWVRLYEKMARIVPESRLRALCWRRRGESALTLASLYQDEGNHLAALQTLLTGWTYSWPYRGWWGGAMKIVLRPFVPSRVLSAYRLSMKDPSPKKEIKGIGSTDEVVSRRPTNNR